MSASVSVTYGTSLTEHRRSYVARFACFDEFGCTRHSGEETMFDDVQSGTDSGNS